MSTRLPAGRFYGQVLRARSVAGLILTETAYAPHTRLPRHRHESAYLCLVRRGTYTEEHDGRTRCCGPLTLAYHPPGEAHAEHFHEAPVLSFNVELPPLWLERLRSFAPALAPGLDAQGGPPAALALRLYRELCQPDEVSPLAVEGLTLELLASLLRPAGATRQTCPPPWLRRAWDLIQSRFAEPLTLAGVAAEVGVHPGHLASVFRRTYGCSVGEAVRRRRVEFASRQLVATDAPLADIALAAGFSDQSHFCNTFKRHTGLAPGAFRRATRSP
jgi:AraC family transcriptional regulator